MYKKSKVLRQIRINLGKGAGVMNACEAAGIDWSTLYYWRRKFKRVDRYIERLLDVRVSLVEDALYKNALKNNIIAQIFFLKNRAYAKWKDRRPEEVPHTTINITYDHRNQAEALPKSPSQVPLINRN